MPVARSLVGLLLGAALVGACGVDDQTTATTPPPVTGAPAPSGDPTDPSVPQASVPEPSVPAPSGSEPSGPASSVPEPSDEPIEPGPEPGARVDEPLVVAVEPVDIAVRPGTDEIYVAERFGFVRRIENTDPGATGAGENGAGETGLGEPLLDVSAELDPGFEEGLLGFVFSPDGRHLYVQTTTGGATTVTAYPVDEAGGIDAAARREIIGFDQPYEAHNGGDLAFGPDGHLYVFSGDGGFVGDPQRRALDLTSLKGKLLRIAPTPEGAQPYRVPADNPFVDRPDALDEIWSYGLRNPWRGSFDPLTGDLWIGDVGDFAWEEVNVAWADEGGGRGVSFGWSAYEGTERFNEDQPADGHEFPFFEYPHGDEGCAITAGERYRGDAIDALRGWFVMADFCTGVVRALEVLPDRTPGRLVELGVVPVPVSVRAGPGGELFVVSIDGGVHPVVAG